MLVDSARKQPDALISARHSELYVIKIDPQEFKLNVKVKLKNIEMWICDYEHS
jgi:hypothetical protein